MKAIIIIFLANLSLISSLEFYQGNNVTTSDLKELRKLLFITRGYDKFARPIPKSDIFRVAIDYSLIHISSFDLRSQTLTTNGWLFYQWHDESLVWDTTGLKHIKNLRVPSDQIYLPDLMAYNAMEYNKQKIVNTNAIVYSNGAVIWVPPMTLKALCSVDLSKWPYDEHICFIKFGSWTHDGLIMDVYPMNKTNPGLLKDIWKNTEFEISYINVTRVEKYYDCCKEPYPSVSFFFRVQRRPNLYHYIISLPAFVAIISSLITFWFPIRSNIRFVLNSFSFLTLTLLLLYLGTHFGFSSLGVPVAVWLTIAYNTSLLKCTIPMWTMRFTKPLLQMYRNTEHETIQLTQSEQLHDTTKKSSQPNAEDLTFIIDKVIFIVFALTIVINAIV
ncbi:unnamed protein product [Oppiella nova]|uniref:Neurotransmitter-gated ion-channel ligand-binding domain-containing protein n=1 Tax=Oppiella nova TaxID=334625 RepID=A0A7R9MJ08_9ACAR|nr:unnamed protein product [Oppiella nova]CAG2177856.1 unnamed protein product [Oppiella nova]